MKYVCCVRARDVGMNPKSIDDQPMRGMSECRVRFGHYGRSFISPATYKTASTKIVVMSRSMFQASIHFRNASNDTVHMMRLASGVNWYRCCIVYGTRQQSGQRLVVA